MATQDDKILDDALAAWRETSADEALSGPARTALFSEVQAMGNGSNEAFVPGLTRAWRWAFLGSVPVVALTAVLMVAGDGENRLVAAPQLTAAKVRGQLVFTLDQAFGNQHTIARFRLTTTTSPAPLRRAPRISSSSSPITKARGRSGVTATRKSAHRASMNSPRAEFA